MANNERYCSVNQSIKQSCYEVKMMRSGKTPKVSWDEFVAKQKKDMKKKTGD